MTDGRTWDLFAVDGALSEAEPASDDAEVWADWYDRKARAGELLRRAALDHGDVAGAADAATLTALATEAARRLRVGK